MENNIKDFKDGVCINRIISRESTIVIGEINDYDLIDNLVKKGREQLLSHNLNRKTNVQADHTGFKSLHKEKLFVDFLNKYNHLFKKNIKKILL